MRKRIFAGFILSMIVGGFAAAAWASPQAQSPGPKTIVTLDDGRVIEGEFVSLTEATLALKDPRGELIFIARNRIAAVAPPLDGLPPAPAQAAAPAGPSVPRTRESRFRFGFSLGGGLNGIDGGDFNRIIRDINREYAEDDAESDLIRNSIYWKQMKSMPDYKAEIFARLGRYFGFSLSVEYLARKSPGTTTLAADMSETIPLEDTCIIQTLAIRVNGNYTQELTVVPITLNLYGYLPIGRRGEAYVFAGPGIYPGRLRLTMEGETWLISNIEIRTYLGYNRIYYENQNIEATEHRVQNATGSAFGFQIGAGFSYALTDRISLFGEALYRRANIKNWKGDGAYDFSVRMIRGRMGEEPVVRESSDSESWSGDLWYYETPGPDGSEPYGSTEIMEEPPNSEYYENVRKAAVNINGAVLRFGIRISFGPGCRPAD